jgi:hypothetical protein
MSPPCRAITLALEQAAATLQLLPPALHLLRSTASIIAGPSASITEAGQAADATTPMFSSGACAKTTLLVDHLSSIHSRLLATAHQASIGTLPPGTGRADDATQPSDASVPAGAAARWGNVHDADAALATATQAPAVQPSVPRVPTTGSHAALDDLATASALYGKTVAASWAAAGASCAVLIGAAARALSTAGGQQPGHQAPALSSIEHLCTEPRRKLKALCSGAVLDTLLGASGVVACMREALGREGRAQRLWPSQNLEAAGAEAGTAEKVGASLVCMVAAEQESFVSGPLLHLQCTIAVQVLLYKWWRGALAFLHVTTTAAPHDNFPGQPCQLPGGF